MKLERYPYFVKLLQTCQIFQLVKRSCVELQGDYMLFEKLVNKKLIYKDHVAKVINLTARNERLSSLVACKIIFWAYFWANGA